jgi:enoyl-CoA hydratase
VHAVVVTGDDDPKPAFCAGGDLDELAAAGEAGPDALQRIYAGFLALAECPLPTFAAVDGPAVGAGLNLALAADVRVAGETARFEPGFLRLGVHPGGGMTWMAQRVVGSQVTTAMLLGGEGLDATRAAELGLVLRVARGEGVDGRSGDEASGEHTDRRSSTQRSPAVADAPRARHRHQGHPAVHRAARPAERRRGRRAGPAARVAALGGLPRRARARAGGHRQEVTSATWPVP